MLRAAVLKNGVASIPALKNGVAKNRHGDGFVALMLAYAASKANPPSYAYESVRTLRQRDGDDDDLRAPSRGLI